MYTVHVFKVKKASKEQKKFKLNIKNLLFSHLNQNLILVYPCFHIEIDICYSVKTEPR